MATRRDRPKENNRNPALRESIFRAQGGAGVGVERQEGLGFEGAQPFAGAETMTVQGTARKALILLLIVFATASVTWNRVLQGEDATALMWLGLLGGLVLALVTIFKPNLAPITSPLYAAAEGLFLGAISAFFQAEYPGIAIQAVLATLGVCLAMFMLYSSGAIRVTNKFRRGVVGATMAIFAVYMVSMLLSFFGVDMPLLHDTGPLGILISLAIIVVASLNLILDFDLIEQGAKQGAPKHLEWYGAFGLLVTLVWLYIEILRLLAILRSD